MFKVCRWQQILAFVASVAVLLSTICSLPMPARATTITTAPYVAQVSPSIPSQSENDSPLVEAFSKLADSISRLADSISTSSSSNSIIEQHEPTSTIAPLHTRSFEPRLSQTTQALGACRTVKRGPNNSTIFTPIYPSDFVNQGIYMRTGSTVFIDVNDVRDRDYVGILQPRVLRGQYINKFDLVNNCGQGGDNGNQAGEWYYIARNYYLSNIAQDAYGDSSQWWRLQKYPDGPNFTQQEAGSLQVGTPVWAPYIY
ncbi:hypothetical protein [Iningainema tapete]|uniref:Uncharacterized protein n=1 Tax=Iningainema tapete BLCC-T55 TaxID=2748662 RepID=A0A8J7CAW5_9CYAN|nr:hypothetical protein [Iningainema tapete]MBD2777631.1 hypothetical protein [Iningainema tapete BLCC-T55]